MLSGSLAALSAASSRAPVWSLPSCSRLEAAARRDSSLVILNASLVPSASRPRCYNDNQELPALYSKLLDNNLFTPYPRLTLVCGKPPSSAQLLASWRPLPALQSPVRPNTRNSQHDVWLRSAPAEYSVYSVSSLHPAPAWAAYLSRAN